MSVRVRFAPSPTGYLHVGGARTALFNYLFARHHGGTFILRIEDTDRTRYQEDACREIYESLEWMGLVWDEGPGRGGQFGPYVQSERTALYREAADRLLESGHAYRCFCSAERLQQLREEQEKAKVGKVMGYDRYCRCLSAADVEEKTAQGMPSVVRLKIPLGETLVVHDAIRGEISYRTDDLDDLVLLKSDGFPTYHLANVVDDHAMQISHVLRGDEWIVSTPRHVLLYQALGWEPPVFAHLPVILSPQGGKLSKRKGAASVMDYKRDGVLPEALFNFLALLGWSPGDDREKMSREDLEGAFSLKKVSPKASVFDERKLEWMNGLYLQERSVESIYDDIVARWNEKGWLDQSSADESYLRKIVGLLKDRSKRLTELADNSGYFFHDPQEYDPKAVKKHFKGEALQVLRDLSERLAATDNFTIESTEDVYRAYAEETGHSGGKLIHPTRLAVSGVSFGPGLFELLEALGKETVVRRLNKAIEWLSSCDNQSETGKES